MSAKPRQPPEPPSSFSMQLESLSRDPGDRYPLVTARFRGSSEVWPAIGELSIEWFADDATPAAYRFDKTYIVTITEVVTIAKKNPT